VGTYATVDTVKSQMPNKETIDRETDPNIAQVDAIILLVEGAFDAALAAGGDDSPATDPSKVKAIGILVIDEVVRRVMIRRTGLNKENSEPSKQYTDTLADMRKGEWAGLADTGSSADDLPDGFTMDAEGSSDTTLQSEFKKGMKF
jgi:hypothetical protein